MLFCGCQHACAPKAEWMCTYIDTPELFNSVESDDLLEKLVPVLL